MRILLADDHSLIRDTLSAFISTADGYEVVAAGTLEEAVNLADDGQTFDLVVLDYDMPGMHGLEGLKRMIRHPDIEKVALISGVVRKDVAEEALALGAAGFLPKTLKPKSLLNALRFMAMGEVYAPLAFMTQEHSEPDHPVLAKLSSREREVLKGVRAGKSNKQIARDLDLAEPTIKLYLKTLYRKLGVSNRTQAALLAQEISSL